MHQVGTVAEFDYTLRVDDKVIETTMEDVAKVHDIWRERGVYTPMVVMLGHRGIQPGLEKALLERAVAGEDLQANLEPKEHYGDRSPDKIVHVPLAKFGKDRKNLTVGMEISDGGRRGTIVKVAGGRATVDYNHPLAGKVLVYHLHVRALHTDEDDAMEAMARYLGHGSDEPVAIEVKDDLVTFHLPNQVLHDPNWQQAKYRFVNDVMAVTKGEKRVRLTETFKPLPKPTLPVPTKPPIKDPELPVSAQTPEHVAATPSGA